MVDIKENYKFDLGVKGLTMRFHVVVNLHVRCIWVYIDVFTTF